MPRVEDIDIFGAAVARLGLEADKGEEYLIVDEGLITRVAGAGS